MASEKSSKDKAWGDFVMALMNKGDAERELMQARARLKEAKKAFEDARTIYRAEEAIESAEKWEADFIAGQ